MVDPALTKLAYWIINSLVPNIKTFFSDFFRSTIFDTMTTEEIQVFFLKIAVEAIIILILYKIGIHFAKKTERKARNKKIGNKKHFKGKTWSPTGWYWDDDKRAWIPPNYLSKESQEKWKWDPEKEIWIDQSPQK